MVSVLALNKLELKDMINSEMIENPVLEELEESNATLDERSGIEGDRERSAEEVATEAKREEKDPFDEIDFGSYFQDYLDPGFKTASNFEEYDKHSFEHFLAAPSTLSDHLLWQLGSLTLAAEVRAAAELIVGNLDANGYLTASDEELAEALGALLKASLRPEPIPFEVGLKMKGNGYAASFLEVAASSHVSESRHRAPDLFGFVAQARRVMEQLDPVGLGARDLRECLLVQIGADRCEAEVQDVFEVATQIVAHCLPLLQKKDMRELTKSCARSADEVQAAVEYIRTLDPRPGAALQRRGDAADRAGCGVREAR